VYRVRRPVEPYARSQARRVRESIFPLLVAGVMLAAGDRALADALSDLEKAHNAYVAHKYDDAEARLHALLDPITGSLKEPDNVADARMYLGASLLAQGKKAEAEVVFEQLLRDKPDYQPDSLRVTLQATDALIDARSRMRQELAAILAEKVRQAQEAKAKVDAETQRATLRLAMLEQLAGEETVVQRNSRWIAAVPFGVGQFQNGQTTLGYIFLTTESILAVGSAVSGVVTFFNELQVDDAVARNDQQTASEYRAYARDGFIVGDVLAAGFALAAIAGIVHAEATFVPEQRLEVRKRPIPPLSFAPSLLPAPREPGEGQAGKGAILGVRGRF
jgi:tetratricopeptide (TPR) repeat protein